MLKHIVDVKMKGKGMRMYQVSKRDGQIAPFNLSKISVAIEKAFKAQDKEYNQDIIRTLQASMCIRSSMEIPACPARKAT